VNSSKKFTLYDIVVVGVMAAIVFALTYFIRIEIPTPAGPTNLKLANAFILLAGMLFGGLRGGLAGGIGSMIFDLINPAYITSAPFTLIFFFMMGFVCGVVSGIGEKKGNQPLWNVIGGIAGAATYFVLHIGKSIIELVLAGSDFGAALVACSTKMVTSGINIVTGVVIAALLAPVLKMAVVRTGVYQKMAHK
jgi:uncharacterized membrane protein